MDSKEATIFITTICVFSVGVHFYLYRQQQAPIEAVNAPAVQCPTTATDEQQNTLSQMKALQTLGFTLETVKNPLTQGGGPSASSASFEMMKHSGNVEVMRTVPPRSSSYSVSFPLDAPLEGLVRDTISTLLSEACGPCKVEEALTEFSSLLRDNRLVANAGEPPKIPQFSPKYCGHCLINGASDEIGRRSRVGISITSGTKNVPTVPPKPE